MKKALVLVMALLFFVPAANADILGDIDGDGKITLNEAIYALRVVANIQGEIPQDELNKMVDSTNETILYITDPDGETGVTSLLKVFTAMGLVEAVESPNAYEYINANFACGTATVVDGDTLNLEFNDCGVSGVVEVTIGEDGQYTVFTMTFTNVVVNGCAINGDATVKAKVDGDQVTMIIESSGLTICGVVLGGSITVVMDKNTGEIDTVQVQNTVSYTMDDGTDVTIVSDITYNSDGTIDGTATTTIGSDDYEFEMDGLIIDPACGIPTSGTITINDVIMDFSSTTCDDPTVTVIIRGIPVEMDLIEALNLVLGEDAVNFLLEELAGMFAGVEEMEEIVNLLDLDGSVEGKRKVLTDPDTVFNNLKAIDFACGTLTPNIIPNRSVTFDFNSASECGIGGVVTVTVTKPDAGIVFELEYDEVEVGECTLDGDASTSLLFGSGVITYTHTSTNLMACGVMLNGEFTVVVDASTGSLESITIDNVAAYDSDNGDATVDSDLVFDPDTGVSGTVDLDKDGDEYECILTNLTFDPACGLPNGGTIKVNGVTLDFSNTTCENQVVIVTVRGMSVEMSIDDAINLLKSEDPAAAMIKYLSDSGETVEGMEGLQDLMDNMGLKNAQQNNGYGDRKSDVVDDILSEIDTEFSCGTATLNVPDKSVELEFDGSCGITGTVVITASKIVDTIYYEIDYDNVDLGGCTIDGHTTTNLAFGDGAIVYTHASDDLSLCGNVISGTATVSLDSESGSLVSVVVVNSATFTVNNKTIEVDASVTYIPGMGLSGTADLVINGKEFECAFYNITIDPACGIPNGGTMTINGITLDFSETTCDNPSVEVSAGAITTTMDIQDVLDLLMSEDPLNALLASVANDKSGQELLGKIIDKVGLSLAQTEAESKRKVDPEDRLINYYLPPDAYDFQCGTIDASLVHRRLTVDFDGSCGITGTVVISVTRPSGSFVYDIKYVDVNMGDCVVDGKTSGSLEFGTGTVTFTHTSTDLEVCGNTFNGQSSIVIDTSDGSVQSVTVDTEITIIIDGESIDVNADLVYDDDGINGTAKIKKGRKTYNCIFEDVTLDETCGIPNGGTITINGIPVNFDSTTCEDPTVTVIIRGREVEMSLEDAKGMIV